MHANKFIDIESMLVVTLGLGDASICGGVILKEISPGCSLEGLMLKLKLQYSGHLMRRIDSFGKP